MQHILSAHLAEERWVSRGCLLSVREEAFEKVPNCMSIRSDNATETLSQRRKQLPKFTSLYMYLYLDSFSTIVIISILKTHKTQALHLKCCANKGWFRERQSPVWVQPFLLQYSQNDKASAVIKKKNIGWFKKNKTKLFIVLNWLLLTIFVNFCKFWVKFETQINSTSKQILFLAFNSRTNNN